MRNEDTRFNILLIEIYDPCKNNDISISENKKDNMGWIKDGIVPILNKHHFDVALIYIVLENNQEKLINCLIK